MLDIVAIISTLILYLISIRMLNLNTFFENMLILLPTLPVIILLFMKKPKNYLKFLSLKNINIKYRANIIITNCEFTELNFKKLENKLIEVSDSISNGIIISNYDGMHFNSTLKANESTIALKYNKINKSLDLFSEGTMSYRGLIAYIDFLLKKLNEFFHLQENVKYKKENLNISIGLNFKDTNGDKDISCKNPFWIEIFKGFDNKTANLFYITKNNTKITLGNSNIDFVSNSIKDIKKDIKAELKFFTFNR